ncbi:damage-inducible protein CinA [Bifidobacterium dolichotidis]|uniref:Damage-inducible protein CinA n=1 Tax=Bifidobacterium dolichotidis TaxID=2306976 RepID=A0A430FSC2_9BIFI|nr:CinA family protein [Bifidobacterium dolichotidis]RSX55765.1 damage-inducible protein CinA [Bifidobacterium dolichotidis]
MSNVELESNETRSFVAEQLNTVEELQHECDQIAADILQWCVEHNVHIACAESLTGGLLADAFVRVPGASRVFLGSAVTYDIRAKHSVLGVDEKRLEQYGAVDPQVALQMAQLTAKLFDQPEYEGRIIGLSTTGVAGPGPDGDKPAGLVFVGVSFPNICDDWIRSPHSVIRLQLQGNREIIRHRSVCCILENLRHFTASSQKGFLY